MTALRRACLRFGAASFCAHLVIGALLSAQVSDTPDLPNPRAWHALKERRYKDAQSLFERAARENPDDASLAFGAGVSLLMRGRNPAARTWFARARELDPGLTDAAILQGQAFHREGRLQDAVNVYEAALVYAPGHPDLLAPVERWRIELDAERDFRRLSGERFSVVHRPQDAQMAREALAALERAHARIGAAFGVSLSRRVDVVLYPGPAFRLVTQLPGWAAGTYDGRIKVPVPSLDQLGGFVRVLEHELVHAFIADVAGPTVPAWLNEGFATALEPGGTEWAAEQRDERPSAPAVPLPRGFRSLPSTDAQEAYVTSTLLAQQLIERAGVSGVVDVLQSVGTGVPFEAAFLGVFGVPVADLTSAGSP